MIIRPNRFNCIFKAIASKKPLLNIKKNKFFCSVLILQYLCPRKKLHQNNNMAKEYNFREIEKKWHQQWVANKTYKVVEDESRKKFYVLYMFPYPSGAGLHVGHPLGYIASDIYARYKRLQGYNVLAI